MSVNATTSSTIYVPPGDNSASAVVEGNFQVAGQPANQQSSQQAAQSQQGPQQFPQTTQNPQFPQVTQNPLPSAQAPQARNPYGQQVGGSDTVNVKQPDKEVNTYQNVTVRPYVNITYADPVVNRTNTPYPVNIQYENYINFNIDTKFGVSAHESYATMYPTGQGPSGQPSWVYGPTVSPDNIVVGNGFVPDGQGGYYRDLTQLTPPPPQSTG